MAKIHYEIETEYDKGDTVVFKKDEKLLVGIVEGFYIDSGAHNSIWYNIRISKDFVYTYSNGGDIAEWDIIFKINDNEDIKNFIVNGK